MLRLLCRLCFLALLPVCAFAQTLTLTHATVVDMVSGRLKRDTTVVITGNRITSVGRSARSGAERASKRAGFPGSASAGDAADNAAGSRAGTSGGQVVDAHGDYLIPGLWDMHTHVFFDRTAGDGTDLILPLFLVNGVTGIRDMGSNLDAVLAARDAIAAHRLLGPRMVVSGPMLDGPKSHYGAAIAITTPESGRQAVDMLKARGADFIKVQSGVPRAAYFAIADEAKKQGIIFEGHVPDAIRASEAVAAGQHTFEHLIGIFEASSPDETKYLTSTKTPGMFLASYDPAREAAMVQLLASHQVWQCPTLYWERGQWLVDAVDYTRDPDLAYAAHSWVTTLWPASQKAILKSLDTDPLAVRQRFVVHELGIVRRLHRAGVPFLAGTDTPAGVDVIPGISLHLELQRFVAAGFTPLEALQTATLNPARFFNRTSDFGTVQVGRIADLVLLRANPLTDIANTRKIAGVVTDGRYLSDAALEQMRAGLRAVAARH